MKVSLNKISGYASAMTSMYISKRRFTEAKAEWLYALEFTSTEADGKVYPAEQSEYSDFYRELNKVCKIGKKHITLLRFIDIEFTVTGIHRGAQDDFDAHAKRLDNRIVRASTRLAKFGDEKSNWYKGKILTESEVLKLMGVKIPNTFVTDGKCFVKTSNGYVRQDLQDDKDVLRGLYRLSIPSDFTAKCNLTEFAHIVKLRDKNSNASPELKEMIESLLQQIETFCPLFTREFFYEIDN